jgi:hypothetical protein
MWNGGHAMNENPSEPAANEDRMPTMRQYRAVAYQLKEIEEQLRSAKLESAADDLARAAAALFGPALVRDFLNESRLVLVNLLLGERTLAPAVMDASLGVIAMIDKAMQEMGEA